MIDIRLTSNRTASHEQVSPDWTEQQWAGLAVIDTFLSQMIAFHLIVQWEEFALIDTSNRTDPDERV